MLACILLILLYINRNVGEKWAIKQQLNPNAKLVKLGIPIVKLVTKKI